MKIDGLNSGVVVDYAVFLQHQEKKKLEKNKKTETKKKKRTYSLSMDDEDYSFDENLAETADASSSANTSAGISTGLVKRRESENQHEEILYSYLSLNSSFPTSPEEMLESVKNKFLRSQINLITSIQTSYKLMNQPGAFEIIQKRIEEISGQCRQAQYEYLSIAKMLGKKSGKNTSQTSHDLSEESFVFDSTKQLMSSI